MISNNRNSMSKQRKLSTTQLQYGIIALALSGCGTGRPNNDSDKVGFSVDYNPPAATYRTPDAQDENFKINEPTYIPPYWVDALLMDSGKDTIDNILSIDDRKILFSFPNEQPSYIPLTILGWAPANDEIKISSRQIFNILEQVLNIDFE